MPDISVDTDRTGGNRRQLDSAPPQPPRQGKSLMAMADGGQGQGGVDMSSPAVQIMQTMGDLRKDLMKMSALLPPLAQGIQQILSGFEQVIPQMVADVVAGNPPGSSGAGMGASQANAAPTAPQVQTGMS
jgi:hypothetical protein